MKKISIIGITILVLFGGLSIYLSKPYEEFIEERKKGFPVSIMVEYVNITGEPGCTNLYQVSNDQVDYKKPIYPAHVDRMKVPDDGTYAYEGNRFSLKGYEYQYVKRNLITGAVDYQPSGRFDIVSWKIEMPYTVWQEPTDRNSPVLTQPGTSELNYEISNEKHETQNFRIDNYVNCVSDK